MGGNDKGLQVWGIGRAAGHPEGQIEELFLLDARADDNVEVGIESKAPT